MLEQVYGEAAARGAGFEREEVRRNAERLKEDLRGDAFSVVEVCDEGLGGLGRGKSAAIALAEKEEREPHRREAAVWSPGHVPTFDRDYISVLSAGRQPFTRQGRGRQKLHLTREEEAVLDGERGAALGRIMELLVAIGDVYGADRLVEVESVQVSGVSYGTIGDAGLEFLEDLSEGDLETCVPSTLNPAGMDLERWEGMGVPEGFAEKQLRIVEAYSSMGVKPTCTCTPYHLDPPSFRDHLAWGESSAVSFANSVLGARTNREGGPSALAAALVGKTPRYGLHLEENRLPDVEVEVGFRPKGRAGYGALGLDIGEVVGDRVPSIGVPSPSRDELKSLGAAMAATGSVALYHVPGVTPEIDTMDGGPCEKLTVEEPRETTTGEDVDLVALGCPHLSGDELRRAASLVVQVSTPLWLFASAEVREGNPDAVKQLEDAGARVFADTCMVVSPLREMGFERVMVDSGKAFTYLPGLGDVEALFASTERCLEVAAG